MDELNKQVLSLAKRLHKEVLDKYQPPDEGYLSIFPRVIPFSIVRNTRGYIEKVVNQVNGCYEKGWFDACAVMIRRLLETLIIEVYEYSNLDFKIKNPQGDFFQLKDLINNILIEPSWNLSKNSKCALPKLKKVGDLSAHSRRYNAHLDDIEDIRNDVRIVVQELLSLANLK